MRLSVIVPAYNEGATIKQNLLEIKKALKPYLDSFEILAVDDGSSDNTKEQILEAASTDPEIVYAGYEKNRGKGGAIKHGVSEARGDVIGFIDADLDISPDHLVRYLEHMEQTGCDVVIGSKMHKESKLDYPPLRKFVSLGYYIGLKILFGMNIKDTQTGVKLYKASLIKKVAPMLKVKGYAFDIEVLALCAHEGARIDPMPVEIVFKRNASFGRISLGDIFKMLFDTIGIWWNLKIRRSYFK
ncbi:MAG: glycosyltransferase family 2 protein [Clostridiales bacterium]|nr:glycosyltransferase family 2 protein [Clostridiales bacterium]